MLHRPQFFTIFLSILTSLVRGSSLWDASSYYLAVFSFSVTFFLTFSFRLDIFQVMGRRYFLSSYGEGELVGSTFFIAVISFLVYSVMGVRGGGSCTYFSTLCY